MAAERYDENPNRERIGRGIRERVWRAGPRIATTRASAAAAVRRRKARPHLAYLGVPLAIIAAAWDAPLLTPLLAFCAWWWAPHEWGYEWIMVVGRGVVGVEWALIGVDLIDVYPTAPLEAGAIWVGVALGIGALSELSRRPARSRS